MHNSLTPQHHHSNIINTNACNIIMPLFHINAYKMSLQHATQQMHTFVLAKNNNFTCCIVHRSHTLLASSNMSKTQTMFQAPHIIPVMSLCIQQAQVMPAMVGYLIQPGTICQHPIFKPTLKCDTLPIFSWISWAGGLEMALVTVTSIIIIIIL